MMSLLSLSPAQAASLVAKAGDTATKVTKDAGGLAIEFEDDSELGLFTSHINKAQSAASGVGNWTAQGRLRLLAKELNDLADAAEKAGVEQPYHKGEVGAVLEAAGRPGGLDG